MSFRGKKEGQLTQKANEWRDNHWIYVHKADVSMGSVSNVAEDIERIEMAGWKLEHVSSNAPTGLLGTLLIFRKVNHTEG